MTTSRNREKAGTCDFLYDKEEKLFFCDHRFKETKQITCNSPRNHSYVRRPQNACDPFMYFWADGDPYRFSISNLYFGDSKGEIWQMPYSFPDGTV
ncbi:MAG: hypothetical protein AB2L24_30115 [Mangrovibacterium sp.]